MQIVGTDSIKILNKSLNQIYLFAADYINFYR